MLLDYFCEHIIVFDNHFKKFGVTHNLQTSDQTNVYFKLKIYITIRMNDNEKNHLNYYMNAKDIILRGFSQQGHSCQEMFFGFTNPESHMVTTAPSLAWT